MTTLQSPSTLLQGSIMCQLDGAPVSLSTWHRHVYARDITAITTTITPATTKPNKNDGMIFVTARGEDRIHKFDTHCIWQVRNSFYIALC
jgi:hypothetical protein